MKDTLHDLVIGNIDGSKLPDMSHFSAAAVTLSQTRQSEMAFRKIPGMIINGNKEALKHAHSNDPKLDIIRRRVESGDVTVSRGLHRGETKFIRKKDLMYRQFTLGNKVTEQLVIPKGFHERVLRLAHDTRSDKKSRYILTMVDYATRYPEAVALPSIETERIVETLVNMFSRVVIPNEMLVDHNSKITVEVMSEVSRLLSLQKLTTIPYSPYNKGPVEKNSPI